MLDPALGPFMLNDAGDPWWRDYYQCDSKATCESREEIWALREAILLSVTRVSVDLEPEEPS